MTDEDQGWMIDDGTCAPCLHGLCYRCACPAPEDIGDGVAIVCCCNEGYEIRRLMFAEEIW
jgi:hypothetical protein